MSLCCRCLHYLPSNQSCFQVIYLAVLFWNSLSYCLTRALDASQRPWMDRRYSMYFQILCCQSQCYDILCHFFFERVATPHFLPFLREQRLNSLKICREGLHFHPPSSLFSVRWDDTFGCLSGWKLAWEARFLKKFMYSLTSGWLQIPDTFPDMVIWAVTFLGLSAENTAAECFNFDLHLQYEKA